MIRIVLKVVIPLNPNTHASIGTESVSTEKFVCCSWHYIYIGKRITKLLILPDKIKGLREHGVRRSGCLWVWLHRDSTLHKWESSFQITESFRHLVYLKKHHQMRNTPLLLHCWATQSFINTIASALCFSFLASLIWSSTERCLGKQSLQVNHASWI